ncbi:hypothetical protein HDU86_005454 [Geranomyces michiganensis]|nr:hypothetical protein HDU86_005454 [Geranomyces michiganensis]
MSSAQPAHAVASDLLIEILVHVGNLAGLLRCESVSRHWRSLLASPHGQIRVWKPLFLRVHACTVLEDAEAAKASRLTWREAVILADAWSQPWPAKSDLTIVNKSWSLGSSEREVSGLPSERATAAGVVKPFPTSPAEVRLVGDRLISYSNPFVRKLDKTFSACLNVESGPYTWSPLASIDPPHRPADTEFLKMRDAMDKYYLAPVSDLTCRIPFPPGTTESALEGNACFTLTEEFGATYAWKIEQAGSSSYTLKHLLTIPADHTRPLCFNGIVLGYLYDDGTRPDPQFRLIRVSDGHELAASTHPALTLPYENMPDDAGNIHLSHTHLFVYCAPFGQLSVFSLRDLAFCYTIELPEMDLGLSDDDYQAGIELGLEPYDEQAYPSCMKPLPNDGSAVYFTLPLPNPIMLLLDPFARKIVRFEPPPAWDIPVSRRARGVFAVLNTGGRRNDVIWVDLPPSS